MHTERTMISAIEITAPIRRTLPAACAAAAALLLLLAGCGDPLSVDTPRRVIPVNIDSILLSEPFFSKPGDTLFAVINGQGMAFNSELLRPVFYNREVGGGWYVSVQGARYDLKGDQYESLSLRLDGVKDTGSFPMQGSFNLPKRVDPTTPSQYVGKYEERSLTGTATYSTSETQEEGAIRVVGIDTARGVIVGTFSFVGHNPLSGSTVRVEHGVFRLRLDVQ